MSEYKEVTDTIEVPRNTGIDGFIHTVRQLLLKPKVQEIRIDARGKITCRRFALMNDNSQNSGVEFDGLFPSAIVRNTEINEIAVAEGANAAVVLSSLMDMVATTQLKALAFISGADTSLWEWFRASTGVNMQNRTSLLGLPLHTDRAIPDTALILTAGYGRDASLMDARSSFKIEMPHYTYPDNDIEVM